MKLKKIDHNHQNPEVPHKKGKLGKHMERDIEPEILKRSPGGYFGRKWFNHTPSKVK